MGSTDDDGERTATLEQQGRSLTPEDPPAIGPYELVGRLGSGGMGTVYLAKGADGELVALKAIRRDFTADPVYRARFHEEVSNARKVASFCTARVLDHGEHDGVLYLVTEYIDGVSLENHLIQQGSLSPSMLHSAAVGVAAALTAIHAAGLVHRDLKPANVMLTLAGPRVIDFGLARSTHVGSRHTSAGMVMGTPGWIAPEQVFEGRTSPAGDVFAWGSLIAYAGLGGHPFGEGDAYVMAARARTAPPDLRGLPAPLDRLVAAAIHPDPTRRPTAKQLLLELVSATDEPAAQLAATRHLSDAWNPAEFPPLAETRRPPHPGPAHHPAPAGPPQGPSSAGPAHGAAPPAHQPPPGAHPAHPAPAPAAHPGLSGQAPQHPGQAPAHPSAGQSAPPGPGTAAPPPVPPSAGPGAQGGQGARPQQAGQASRPRSAAPSGGPRSGQAAPGSRPPGRVPRWQRPGRTPAPHQTGQIHQTGQVHTGQVPMAHQRTGQGPLPPRRGVAPKVQSSRPGRSVLTGCLAAVLITLVFLALLVAVLTWMSRNPTGGDAGGQVRDHRLTFTVTG